MPGGIHIVWPTRGEFLLSIRETKSDLDCTCAFISCVPHNDLLPIDFHSLNSLSQFFVLLLLLLFFWRLSVKYFQVKGSKTWSRKTSDLKRDKQTIISLKSQVWNIIFFSYENFRVRKVTVIKFLNFTTFILAQWNGLKKYLNLL